MFSYITYIIASLIQHIKPVTPTELQHCGVACSPFSPSQRPLCIVGGRAVPLRFIFLDYYYFYWDTKRELVGRREACGTRQLFLFSYFGCFLTLWLWCELLFLPLSLPPLLFFGSRSIFRAAKTENPASPFTGSPSSKYEHRRALALLRNTQNIRICMGKKPIVSVTYENERISIKKYINVYREKTVYIKTHKTAINRPVNHTGET